jgi:hypothetical protein
MSRATAQPFSFHLIPIGARPESQSQEADNSFTGIGAMLKSAKMLDASAR